MVVCVCDGFFFFFFFCVVSAQLVLLRSAVSHPSSRKVLTLTASGRPAMPGAGVMRTPGEPVVGSGGALPESGSTKNQPGFKHHPMQERVIRRSAGMDQPTKRAVALVAPF